MTINDYLKQRNQRAEQYHRATRMFVFETLKAMKNELTGVPQTSQEQELFSKIFQGSANYAAGESEA